MNLNSCLHCLITFSAFLSSLLIGQSLVAQTPSSVVDRQTPLELVSSDFVMADGPCWDGWSLIVPDVKGGNIARYIPKKQSLQKLVPDSGRISASFFNHGRVYLSDNGE